MVSDVDRVLGRPRGIRIGEAPDRDGQYFHYLAMWLYALSVLARYVPAYRRKGVDLVHQIHTNRIEISFNHSSEKRAADKVRRPELG